MEANPRFKGFKGFRGFRGFRGGRGVKRFKVQGSQGSWDWGLTIEAAGRKLQIPQTSEPQFPSKL
jgi:hypothetical protein